MIDCCVRVVPASDGEIMRRLPQPFRNLPLGPVLGSRYVPPIDDFDPEVVNRAGRDGISDPQRIAGVVFGAGARAAVLLPPTRVLRADARHDVAVARATNEWMADTWLSVPDRRWGGSIVVSPYDGAAAAREIERWATDERFVQVAVPLVTPAPFGEERFFDIWAAAARFGLPVAVYGGASGGIEPPATFAGMPEHFIEYFTLLPTNGAIQLASLISEGVFERLPTLRFVFCEGGMSIFPTLLWRHDSKWRALKGEMPWTLRTPSEYLETNVRFVLRRHDIPTEQRSFEAALRLSHADRTLVYGSNTPMWDRLAPPALPEWLAPALRARLIENALSLYPRLEPLLRDPAPAPA